MTEDQDFALFIQKVKQYSAIDLSQYKEAQMKRRLTTLYAKRGFSSFAAFFDAMKRNRELYDEFLDRMTINVSEFWRNPNRWAVLEARHLPDLARNTRRLKCWSAACSTGEEPYTLAMIMDKLGVLSTSTIHATDIDEGALDKAKQGVYAERSLRDVPPAYVQAYFRKKDMSYAIVDSLKQKLRFSRQNLLHDPFETGYDLIVCRNVMIYFTEEAKHVLYHKFSGALKPGGLLFVGSTEQIFSPGQYDFESADTFIYRKR